MTKPSVDIGRIGIWDGRHRCPAHARGPTRRGAVAEELGRVLWVAEAVGR